MMPDFKGADALLLIGASEHNADLQYATGFLAPDPFAYIQMPERTALIISELEIDRARSQARVNEVLSIAPLRKRVNKIVPTVTAFNTYYAAVALALNDFDISKILVPADFPIGAGDYLRSNGFDLLVATPPLFPERAVKSSTELDSIRESLLAAQAGMAVAITALQSSTIGADDFLQLENEVLTSEKVRYMIHKRLLEFGCTAKHTIVSCGTHTCDPHESGHGPIRAHQPIVLDIFPQSSETRYFGDITRTVVKGRANENLRFMYDIVLRGQEQALAEICDGADSMAIHNSIHEMFTKAGYVTGKKGGRMQGFFHGTGHGLGLEIHEAPSISAREGQLTAGQVVTVEPGLYYYDIGGVRIEDVVCVTADGCTMLTDFPKFLEL